MNTAELIERARLVAELRRANPFGGYCDKPCDHPGHTNAAYRETLARYRGAA